MNHDITDIIHLINVMHDKAVLVHRHVYTYPQEQRNQTYIKNLIDDIKMMARQIIYDDLEEPVDKQQKL